MTRRIFASPWVVDDTSTVSFCIRDAKGHALRYVNYEDETGGPTMAGGTSAGDDGDQAGKEADGEEERAPANEVARPCGGAPNSATAGGEESE